MSEHVRGLLWVINVTQHVLKKQALINSSKQESAMSISSSTMTGPTAQQESAMGISSSTMTGPTAQKLGPEAIQA
jgi:hypothetical protein